MDDETTTTGDPADGPGGPLARLRAADPAGADPDLEPLRSRVLAELDELAETDEPRAKRGWLLPAAAGIVVVAVVGAGGFALGRSSEGSLVAAPAPDTAAAAAPSAAPEAGVAASSAPEIAGEGTSASMADAPAAESKAVDGSIAAPSSMSPMIFPGAPTIWTAASSVPDSPSVATGYVLSSADLDREALAGELASILGLEGTPAPLDGGVWQVGGADGSGPSLSVGSDGMASWSYYDPTVASIDGGGQPMDADEAQRLARGLLRDAGVPVREVEWQVEASGPLVTVTAWQLVSDLRTGLTWNVTLAPDGEIASASGFAAGLVPVPGYELVGAATAVERIAQPGWSALGPSMVTAPPAPEPATEATVTAPPPAPRANGRPTVTATVSSVRFSGSTVGLAAYWQPDGTVLVLPSYVLEDDEGGRWSLLAVDDRYVRFVEPDPGAPMPLDAAR